MSPVHARFDAATVRVGARMLNEADIVARLAECRAAHRVADDALRMAAEGDADDLERARLKRQKLRLKDEIAALERSLIPDIIA